MDTNKLRISIDRLLEHEDKLSAYASYATLELERSVASKPIGFNAGKKLIQYIRTSVDLGMDYSGEQSKYLNSCLLVALSDAISYSKIDTPDRNVGDFLKQADGIISCLEEVFDSGNIKSNSKYNITQLRDFCLALSERASTQDYPHVELWKNNSENCQICLA